ncbi:YncE family protein [Pseudonocardia sp. K10HN5]|uniref:YncE family protein n=1 Tax=Pseudonocardia acidicola TaxID=2724939 RepID=A0ABX1SD89_9PSEU|nr:YncE family protein [Pseudonocardia acidicola]NMH99535.1 YncE family protein [Pseudonocardia acidicola]
MRAGGPRAWRPVAAALLVALAGLAGCSADPGPAPPPGPVAPAAAGPGAGSPLPGMPPVTNSHNVYADAGAGMLSDAAKAAKPLVYVPHTKSGDVWVIDPATFAVVGKYRLGGELQHVVPSYDMKTLYASDDTTNKVTPFDPTTGKPGANIPVTDPYNMYFTPDGTSAISVAEERKRLVFYDPHTWKEQQELLTPDCAGIDHADFTPDGRTAVFTCEFAGRVAVVDIANRKLLRMIDLPTRNTMMGPQDIKLAPDGSVFYIADSQQNGVWVLDGAATRVLREIPTGLGAHGLYLSRDATRLFVTNRREGSVSVLDAYTGAVITKWRIPGGGSPDMGNVTADGRQLWLSGRYDRVVYVLSTTDGHLITKIPVGNGPHGLCVWPQPGRYSLGHTGITR